MPHCLVCVCYKLQLDDRTSLGRYGVAPDRRGWPIEGPATPTKCLPLEPIRREIYDPPRPPCHDLPKLSREVAQRIGHVLIVPEAARVQ